METKNVIQLGQERMTIILDRLDMIPEELDVVSEQLFRRDLTRKQFTDLTVRWDELLAEKEDREKELKEVYRMLSVEIDRILDTDDVLDTCQE